MARSVRHKYAGIRNLKTQKAVAHAQRALQLFGFLLLAYLTVKLSRYKKVKTFQNLDLRGRLQRIVKLLPLSDLHE